MPGNVPTELLCFCPQNCGDFFLIGVNSQISYNVSSASKSRFCRARSPIVAKLLLPVPLVHYL